MGFLTQVFMGIIFNDNDVINDLFDDKVLVNVDTTETTEVVGDAGNFVKDAKEKNHNNIIIHSVHQCMTCKTTNTQQACLSMLTQWKRYGMQAPL
jgi:hypothetical protein